MTEPIMIPETTVQVDYHVSCLWVDYLIVYSLISYKLERQLIWYKLDLRSLFLCIYLFIEMGSCFSSGNG